MLAREQALDWESMRWWIKKIKRKIQRINLIRNFNEVKKMFLLVRMIKVPL